MHSVLSLDLMLEILDCLALPLHFHQRSCDLSAWSSHAQRLLFRRVILPSNVYRNPLGRGAAPNSLPSFLAAIDPGTERGRWLSESVVSLTLRHTGRTRTADSAALATALLRTPNLRHLDVTTIFCNFDTETVARLREFGPRLASLSVLQDSPPLRAPHAHHAPASRPLPVHQATRITSNLNFDLAPFDPPPNLSLVCAKFNTTLAVDIGPCLTSLLNPEADTPSRSSEPHFARARAHLRSIALRTIDPVESSAVALAECRVLERFELGRFPDAATIALIPRSIRALAICGEPENGEGDSALLRELEKYCQLRGIQLRASAVEMHDENAVEIELKKKYIRI
ncbi:hypothetical protein B0H12DRAFT_1155541 [Mycena haematopus]|nr:hypothetical protein B0H12DRAFT_1155541 [Mycena haematopus]